MNKKNKEFFLSSWAINNKTIIYVLMTIFLVSGITAYKTMPRELFPEINSSNIFVTTIFPGNNAEEIEKLITELLKEDEFLPKNKQQEIDFSENNNIDENTALVLIKTDIKKEAKEKALNKIVSNNDECKEKAKLKISLPNFVEKKVKNLR